MQFDYRPQTKLREGNVFTGVFLSMGKGGEGGGEYVSSDDHQVSLVGVAGMSGGGEVSMSGGKGGYPRYTHLYLSYSGGHQNTYGWQAVGMHTTGMLSCLVMRLKRHNHVSCIK